MIDSEKVDRSNFQVVQLTQSNDDTLEYWRNRPIEERLAAIEFQRQQMFGYDPNTERLQRVLTVIKRK